MFVYRTFGSLVPIRFNQQWNVRVAVQTFGGHQQASLDKWLVGFYAYITMHLLALQVETIGDAYMVVGGVPVPIASHGERVANFALGMRIAARDVMNPITTRPIQVIRSLKT